MAVLFDVRRDDNSCCDVIDTYVVVWYFTRRLQ